MMRSTSANVPLCHGAKEKSAVLLFPLLSI